MLNSWKTNVFGQFSLNLPKIDVLPKMFFFAFWDNVFFSENYKNAILHKSPENRQNAKKRFSHFFSVSAFFRKTYRETNEKKT